MHTQCPCDPQQTDFAESSANAGETVSPALWIAESSADVGAPGAPTLWMPVSLVNAGDTVSPALWPYLRCMLNACKTLSLASGCSVVVLQRNYIGQFFLDFFVRF